MTNNTIDYSYESKPLDVLTDVLVGKQVTSVDKVAQTLTLNDGTTLKVEPNLGDWEDQGAFLLDALDGTENAITSVTLKDRFDATAAEGRRESFEIFVYTEGVANEQRLVSVVGDSGNGYYGSGFKLTVTR